MTKIMKKMGRTLGNSNFSKMLSETESVRVFVLKSGAEARFVLTRVLHDDIEEQTYIDAAVNGRDQAFLTPESVSDISRTIKLQQFFPAIGREVNGRVEVLDGSRRRAACIYNDTPFEVLVTKDELTLADARQLAIDIQTAKEHTLRELGKRLKLMYPENLNQSEIAAAEGISAAKVTRAFQAASVPDEIMGVFPSVSDLSIADYQTLLDIAEKARARKISMDVLASNVRERIEGDPAFETDDPGLKNKIIGYFRTENAGPKNNKTQKKVITEKIADFANNKQFARKKTDTEKRQVSYEFSRLPPVYQAELDAAIKAVIERMLADTQNG
ncbi:MAG: ParB/RepB/Spo0J family partition protein [Enterobacterales bacterium endosymbiont of Blomia tropicalis]|uniref:ParB/RepB/Spo0J family partition protein n=1 Tax=Mixta mediterraneensis TaxID=2758443 RepID=UPI0018735154|nr:ParB/RepB/Spo0J family partition protein [Mixta mediterraneensis]MBE5254190.1 ParB/RepB/Spo0J family partition protein [Mixta mediterraneensis]MDL4915131.1 ParB/RepB/Spo0J family partition protein [Mixta mediterraneensis]